MPTPRAGRSNVERVIRPARPAECGFTLVEIVVVVAILFIIAGSAYEALAQRPAQIRSSAIAFAGLIAQARSLASVTGDPFVDGGGGASIGVVRDGDDYIATLYAYRPVRSAGKAPEREPNTAPLRLSTAIALKTQGGVAEPPFALFFSPSGHVSAQPGFLIGSGSLLATEPACPLATGIVVEFSDAMQAQTHVISCEMAQLDLDGRDARPPLRASMPRRAL